VANAAAEQALTYSFNPQSKVMTVGFQDLHMVSSGGVDVFALNLNDWPNPPPFYLEVDGRLFSLQPSNTYLVTGHGAALPTWITAEEAEGRLTLLAEREDRYLVYSHDSLAIEEDDEDEEATEDDGDEAADSEDEAEADADEAEATE
jgi:hypothetical protein